MDKTDDRFASDERKRQEKARQAFHEGIAATGEEDHMLCIYRIVAVGATSVFLWLSSIAIHAVDRAIRGISLFGGAMFFFVALAGWLFAWLEKKNRESAHRTVSVHAGGNNSVQMQTAEPVDITAPNDGQPDALTFAQAGYTINDRKVLRECAPCKPDTIDGLGRFVMDDHRDYSGVNFLFKASMVGALIAAAGGLLVLAPNYALFAQYEPVLNFMGKIIAGMGGFFFVVMGLMHFVFVKGRLGYRIEIDKTRGALIYHTYWFAFHFKNKYQLSAFNHIFVPRIKIVSKDSMGFIRSETEFRVYLAGQDLLGVVHFDAIEKANAFAAKLSSYLDLPVKVNEQETVLSRAYDTPSGEDPQ